MPDAPVAEAISPATSWRRTFLTSMAWVFVFAFATIWIASSYFAISPAQLISHIITDQHCHVSTQSFGGHCFSDFAIAREIFHNPDPWNADKASTSYPPIAWVPALAALVLGDHVLGIDRASTVIYLLAAGLAASTPALWAMRGRWRADAPLIALLTSVGAAPVLALLDRGNTLAFCIPFLLLTAIGYARGDSRLLFIGLVGAALLKPQMIVLAVLPLTRRQFRVAFGSVATAGVLTVAGFLIHRSPFPQNLFGWLRAMFGYNSYLGLDMAYPYNLGFGRSIVTMVDLTIGSPPWLDRPQLIQTLSQLSPVLTLLMLAIGLGALAVAGSRAPAIYSLTLAFLMAALSSSVVAIYYLTPFTIIAALLLRDPLAAPEAPRLGILDRERFPTKLLPIVITVATVAALAPIAIPYSNPLFNVGVWAKDAGYRVGLYQMILGPLLLVTYLFLAFSALSFRKRPSNATAPIEAVPGPS